jgi:hypothetical protein
MKSADVAYPYILPLRGWQRIVVIAGPGIVVMLADTDAGSIITAAQSGAEWGYQLLVLQFILVPVLYIVQELTVRLGIVTRKGHAELIRDHFGKRWAWLSVATLVLAPERVKRIGGCRSAHGGSHTRHHDADRLCAYFYGL